MSDAVADIIALRALTAVDREDGQQRAVASITEQFMFLEGTGANVADDGKFVIKPNDIALGSDGRWYRVPFQISKNLLDALVHLTDADATLTLADGRRYRLPNATLTRHRTVTPSNAGVVAGDTITIFSEQKDGPDITFAEGPPKTITRSHGSWILDGFTSGMSITTTAPLNGAVPLVIANVPVTHTMLTVTGAVKNEGPVKARVEGKKLTDGIAAVSVDAHNALVVRNAAGTVILNIVTPGAYVAEFDGAAWTGKTPAGLQVFNVKDYGAIGDERIVINPTLFKQEAAAIQGAIDAAAAAGRDASRDGGVVYFPPGRYRTDGFPLILRRTLYVAPILYLGAGCRASTIQNGTGVGPLGDTFRVETIAENGDITHGGEQHSFQDLAIEAKHYCLIWDYGDTINPGTNPGVRFAPRFLRCFFSRRNSPGPCVRLSYPSRARFTEVCSIRRPTRPESLASRLCRVRCDVLPPRRRRTHSRPRRFRDESSRLPVRGCGISAWDFYNVVNLRVDNATNEGNDEVDAVFASPSVGRSPATTYPRQPRPADVTMTALRTFGAPDITFAHSMQPPSMLPRIRSPAQLGRGSRTTSDTAARSRSRTPSPTPRGTGARGDARPAVGRRDAGRGDEDGATGSGTSPTRLLRPTHLPDITFAEGPPKTITRADGSWIVDGLPAGCQSNYQPPLPIHPRCIHSSLTRTSLSLIPCSRSPVPWWTRARSRPESRAISGRPALRCANAGASTYATPTSRVDMPISAIKCVMASRSMRTAVTGGWRTCTAGCLPTS